MYETRVNGKGPDSIDPPPLRKYATDYLITIECECIYHLRKLKLNPCNVVEVTFFWYINYTTIYLSKSILNNTWIWYFLLIKIHLSWKITFIITKITFYFQKHHWILIIMLSICNVRLPRNNQSFQIV